MLGGDFASSQGKGAKLKLHKFFHLNLLLINMYTFWGSVRLFDVFFSLVIHKECLLFSRCDSHSALFPLSSIFFVKFNHRHFGCSHQMKSLLKIVNFFQQRHRRVVIHLLTSDSSFNLHTLFYLEKSDRIFHWQSFSGSILVKDRENYSPAMYARNHFLIIRRSIHFRQQSKKDILVSEKICYLKYTFI